MGYLFLKTIPLIGDPNYCKIFFQTILVTSNEYRTKKQYFGSVPIGFYTGTVPDLNPGFFPFLPKIGKIFAGNCFICIPNRNPDPYALPKKRII